jgi:Trp operon repressor
MTSTPKNKIVKQRKAKKINATLTQIISYAQFKESNKAVLEKQYVLEVFKLLNKECSRRQIQELTGLPINHVTRILYDLEIDQCIYVSKTAKCQYTSRTVNHYSLFKDADHEQ